MTEINGYKYSSAYFEEYKLRVGVSYYSASGDLRTGNIYTDNDGREDAEIAVVSMLEKLGAKAVGISGCCTRDSDDAMSTMIDELFY